MKKLCAIAPLLLLMAGLNSMAPDQQKAHGAVILEAQRILCATYADDALNVSTSQPAAEINKKYAELIALFDNYVTKYARDRELSMIVKEAASVLESAKQSLAIKGAKPFVPFSAEKLAANQDTQKIFNAENFKKLGFRQACIDKLFPAKKPVNPSTLLYEKIVSAAPYEIYQQFNNLSIPAFAVDSFSRSGIQKEDFDKWANYAQAANGYVTSQINKGAAAKGYALQVTSLNDILSLVKNTAQKLKDKQIGAARKQETENELRKKLQEASLIEKTTFDSIARQNPAPADWIAKADSSKLMIQTDTKGSISYGSFFSQWDKLQQGTKGRVFTDSDFMNFLKENGITSKYKFADVADTLDQVVYRLQKDNEKLSKEIETSWFGNDGRKKKIESNLNFINTAQAIIKRIRGIYPSASSLQMAQISTTKDKVGTILYAQASIYQIALNKLMKEVQAL
ncbi:hypothetical protein HYX58_03200 [Candidatus Dependentiae bacterium]|nr:hypothetical protein [Candidatus Dependentiae bacterium]